MSNTNGFTPPQGGASITDILTALKNVATAINGWTQQQQTLAGTSNSPNITAATLVKGGAGRLVGVSIVVQGSADGATRHRRSVRRSRQQQALHRLAQRGGRLLPARRDDIPRARRHAGLGPNLDGDLCLTSPN